MHDLIVVSDLHIGRGKNPESGRYYELEAFFYDDDFRRFCEWIITDARAEPCIADPQWKGRIGA